MKLTTPLLIAGLCSAFALSPVFAAATDASAAAMEGMHGHRMHFDAAKREEMAEKYLQREHDQLKIQPAQEKAWQAYAAAVKGTLGLAPAHMDAQATAPERLDNRLKVMQHRVAALQKQSVALKALYQQLTPQQRQQLDQDARHLAWRMQFGRHHQWPHGAASAAMN